MLRRLGLAIALCLAALPAWAQGPTFTQQAPTRLDVAVSAQHSHTSAATVTLTGQAGLYIYIVGLDIGNCAGTAVTAAAPTFITTTNLTGAPQYMLGSNGTAGLCQPMSITFPAPLKASGPGTNVTFVLPTFVAQQTASLNVYYYLAP